MTNKTIGIGFGTWAWGNKLVWGYKAETDDILLKKTFFDAINGGLDLVDSADSYGTGSLFGQSEKLIGDFLEELPKRKLKKITIATKLAPFPWRIGRNGLNKAFQESNQRLKGNMTRVQLHWSTYRYAPWQEEQLLNGLGDLYEEGLIKEINGIETLKETPGLIKYGFFRGKGEIQPPIRMHPDRFGYVIVSGKDREEAEHFCQIALDSIIIEVE